MISSAPEDQKKAAFTLFERGEYEQSYALCRELRQLDNDPSISVLCAANLFHMGRLEEAEAFFRDLSHSLPGTSHVHSYLGRILELKGDDGALAEYARAVALDPGNLEALRSFASFVLKSGDPKKAVPVFSHLYSHSRRADDARLLARALLLSGRPSEALEVWEHVPGGRLDADEDYIAILSACGRFGQVAESAMQLFGKTKNPLFARRYLEALSRVDRQRAREEYPRLMELTGDREIRYGYVLFQKEEGNFSQALAGLSPLLSGERTEGKYFLLECELLSLLQRKEDAAERYRDLLDRELDSMADPAFIQELLSRFRTFLQTHYPFREAESILLASLSARTDPFSLLAVARFYEDAGDRGEARSWYYRAYRSDSMQGGPPYAWFCYRNGDMRECEKVMIYVVGSARKVQDLLRVADSFLQDKEALFRMPRLLERLKARLEEVSEILPSRGMEILAAVYLLWGAVSLEKGDSLSCKRSCLAGLDVIPQDAGSIRAGDFLALLEKCKKMSLSEIPVLFRPERGGPGLPEPHDTSLLDLDLDENERKVLELLRTRHQATEMELRTLLGSRRVAGIINRIMQKASSKGLVVIEKKGVGKDGEIYAYRNT
ncbi:MAG: hypothetical protein QHH04_00900 [Methanolinea sp.]|nr:hypothetical protein [Methanolinea sp.]